MANSGLCGLLQIELWIVYFASYIVQWIGLMVRQNKNFIKQAQCTAGGKTKKQTQFVLMDFEDQWYNHGWELII